MKSPRLCHTTHRGGASQKASSQQPWWCCCAAAWWYLRLRRSSTVAVHLLVHKKTSVSQAAADRTKFVLTSQSFSCSNRPALRCARNLMCKMCNLIRRSLHQCVFGRQAGGQTPVTCKAVQLFKLTAVNRIDLGHECSILSFGQRIVYYVLTHCVPFQAIHAYLRTATCVLCILANVLSIPGTGCPCVSVVLGAVGGCW